MLLVVLLALVAGVGTQDPATAPRLPDLYLNTVQMASRRGYRVKPHQVESDGYILTVHRLSRDAKPVPGPPVFLQHGLLCASDSWLVAGPGHALAYQLCDAGFDVWMGNTRGNTYSLRHRSMSTANPKFWNYSFHEMAVSDLAAVIDYILKVTGESQIEYVGHSMGTTMFFVLMSMRPEYNDKVRSMIALAPVGPLIDLKSSLVHLSALVPNSLWKLLENVSMNILPNIRFVNTIVELLCSEASPAYNVCKDIYFNLVGEDEQQLNSTMMPLYYTRMMHGTTLKVIHHYQQLLVTDGFRQYDYGPEKNMEIYGSKIPPEYDLSRVSTPVTLFYGENDVLATPEMSMEIGKHLPNVKLKPIPFSKFNHMDFLWGNEVNSLVNEHVLELLRGSSQRDGRRNRNMKLS